LPHSIASTCPRLASRLTVFTLAALGPLAATSPAGADPARFYAVRPCRAVDTRQPASPFGGPALAAGATRVFALAGACNTSPTAVALALNLTVTQPTAAGHLRLFPAGTPLPNSSTLSYALGKTRANSAIIATGTAGGLAVYNGQATGSAHVIIDVNGYFDDPTRNQPPVVSVGGGGTILMPGAAILTGSATDDGLPGAPLTYTWSKVSGPGNVSFTSGATPNTNANFAVAGTYLLRLTVSDSALSGFADVQVRVDPTQADAVRFLHQVSFGATAGDLARLQAIGISAYFDEQMAAAPSGLPNLPPMPGTRPSTCTGTCQRDNYTLYPIQASFYVNSFYGLDQLRQRVAWALHKIIVVSGGDGFLPSRYLPYLRVFQRNAFGNYRQLLEEITLNPAMGAYLDMATSTRQRPNENYAREILQIFSIGTDLLNPDGTPQVDSEGQPLPAYDEAVVGGFAKAFTGWTFAADPAPGIRNYFDPLVLRATNHDTTAKTLLRGVVLPPNQTGQQDMAQALDNIFQHPNMGPYIGRRLIRELVTSNPSPAYVARVAEAFDDNGFGVRGDMRAVVKAIIFDPEARGPSPVDVEQGRLRDPVLFATGMLRALGVRSADGLSSSDGHINPQVIPMGMDTYKPPNVFSYYPAEFLVPGTVDLLGPEFGVLNASTALRRANFVNTMVFSRINTGTDAPRGTSLNLAPYEALAGNPSSMVDELSRVLMNGSMSAAMKAEVVQAVNAVPATNARLRAQQAVYLVCTSSQYQVQR
jgi:hypothetical protein